MYLYFIENKLALTTSDLGVNVDNAVIIEIEDYDPTLTYTLVNGTIETQVTPHNPNIAEDMQKFEYMNQRATAYPSVVDQLDILYHGGYDAWREQIQAVKDEFPKPI